MVAYMNAMQTGGVQGRVTRAIANAARSSGMDFSYLMGQARIESSLNPNAHARTSSASGLFQFIEQSWLGVINKHGAQYGLGWASDAISQGGNGHYYVADPQLRQQILDLREHPETASAMAAEFARDNKAMLEGSLGRPATSTDLYLAHFLGVGGATRFLSALQANPEAPAASILPTAARANRHVFYDGAGNPRSLAEVQQNFATKLAAAGSDVDAPIGGDGGTVMPADYVRIATARLKQQEAMSNGTTAVQPEQAKLAYLLLASLGA